MPKSITQYKMPTKTEVEQELSRLKKDLCRRGPDEQEVEVRLRVEEGGGWQILWGDPQYDQNHQGAWGCASLDSKSNCRSVAKYLLDECEEHASQLRDG